MSFSGDFSYDFYIRLINHCKLRGTIIALRDYPQSKSNKATYIWRHDIDVDLVAAVQMAAIEAKLGVSSTYMVIPGSRLYDISTSENRQRLREFIDLGHEVALHFDTDSAGVVDPNNTQDVEARIIRDLDRVACISGVEVKSISFHRPIDTFLRGPRQICGCVNAYAEELMEFYISDSKGAWRQGNPLETLDNFDHSIGQILTHPIWWATEHHTPNLRLENYFRDRTLDMTLPEKGKFDHNLRLTVPAVMRQGLID